MLPLSCFAIALVAPTFAAAFEVAPSSVDLEDEAIIGGDGDAGFDDAIPTLRFAVSLAFLLLSSASCAFITNSLKGVKGSGIPLGSPRRRAMRTRGWFGARLEPRGELP